MNKLDKVMYTATAKSTGGRDGITESNDGRLKMKLSVPKAMGGDDGPGTNPEQLFASGYSACFIGAMKFVAGQQKLNLPDGFNIEAKVGIGQIPQGFGIKVDMQVNLPGMDKNSASALVEKAHQVCPYSNATRGNIEVGFNVTT
jgi:lipoyl-dependent peroxiredoxin